MKKLLLIVNPCSGQKKAKRQLMEIISIFNRLDYSVCAYITAGIGDGEAAAVRFAEEVDRIVCCGGDGTFNEVISGVLKSGQDIPIGYIPAGSTNDFAASLSLSSNLLQAARAAAADHIQRLDVGDFGGRYFSYVASFGAFSKTSYTTPQNMKNILGHAAYILSGIQELSQLKTYPLHFELEDGTILQGDFIFGAITNSTSVGGILTLSPERVNLADGAFELLLIRAPKDLIELGDCVRALQKKTYDCAMLSFLSTSRIKIAAPENMSWTLDGEYEPGHSQVQVQCIHKAIQVVCGEAVQNS